MKRRTMKKRIFASVMVAGMLVSMVPWAPVGNVKAMTLQMAEASGEELQTPEPVEPSDKPEIPESNTETPESNTETSEDGSQTSDHLKTPEESTQSTEDSQETSKNTNTEVLEDSENTEATEADKKEKKSAGKSRYQGITIDGDFSDWDAVAKYDTNQNALDEVAMVWDGDMIYLYFGMNGNSDGAGNWNEVSWSGPNGTGVFAITTDLGKTLKFQLCNDATVLGVNGASVAVNNKEWDKAPHMWEVSIPASNLPAYKNTISLGYYAADTLISDVANLQGGSGDGGSDSDPDKKEDNVLDGAIDGNYGEWENYPHTLIQYATNGSHDNVDGEAALYSADGMLYAHVQTEMRSHLQEAGGEFTSAVTIRINGTNDFYPQFVMADSAGNINYYPQLSNLSEGTYELYLIDAQGWKTATNISDLQSEEGRSQYHNALYGHMYMTIGAAKDEMEFNTSLKLLAEKFGMSSDDIRTVEGQWGRIGPQWVSTAGTSTGAWLGLLICFAAVGAAYAFRRRRERIAG